MDVYVSVLNKHGTGHENHRSDFAAIDLTPLEEFCNGLSDVGQCFELWDQLWTLRRELKLLRVCFS